MAARLALLGLGAMGHPIARNLAAKRGSDAETLVAIDTDPARLAGLAAPGLVATTDPGQAAGADVLFLCLPNGDAVEAALLGDGALAERLAPGAVVVDLSTIAHAKALTVGRAVAATGRAFVDAPVSGAPAGAEAGTLTVMCGGAAGAVARVRPLLERIGTTILHMGPAGSGQLTKTINNVLYDINIAALAEVLPMAVAMGLDPDQVAQVVTTGTSQSYAAQYFVPRILRGQFDEGYPMGAAYKDLVAAAAVAAENGFPMPVTAAATATYQTALRQGHGDRDKGAMVLPFEDLLGVRVRSRP
ncbi:MULTISPECIES: NAD(P)-dependent oxidoreductase [unclassified Methylobacterium]|uniref:NAD(P)-dependent oxidoreductase n=2 Tax=Methylobacterium TaxID=407 RepID=UPI00034CC57E|nr:MULTISPECIES: NAD(P)-dependent oxidoreductase [unclassified Methylobacterium]MBN4095427.1 NAD(P)-dependent oxidoreductase [Methylobacterium sp. OT2]SEF94049.1 3-hydroxyisobutyrate dehydrogenase [Methylobacterium sp. 190mf]